MRSKSQLHDYVAPKTKDKYVGIEVEFCSPIKADRLLDCLMQFNLQEYVTLKSDGSVVPNSNPGPCGNCWGCQEHLGCELGDNRYDNPYELCLLVKEQELDSVLNLHSKFFSLTKSYANLTCGLHVHLDMRSRNSNMAFVNLVLMQDILYGVCKPTRKNNGYCKPTIDLSIDHALKRGRYQGINPCSLSRHNTIEVRIHHGTVDVEEIRVWTKLLINTIESPPIQNKVSSFEVLEKTLTLSGELAKAIKTKLELYAEEHRKTA